MSYLLTRGSAGTALAPLKLRSGFLFRVDRSDGQATAHQQPPGHVSTRRAGEGLRGRATRGYDSQGQRQEGQRLKKTGKGDLAGVTPRGHLAPATPRRLGHAASTERGGRRPSALPGRPPLVAGSESTDAGGSPFFTARTQGKPTPSQAELRRRHREPRTPSRPFRKHVARPSAGGGPGGSSLGSPRTAAPQTRRARSPAPRF